MSQMIACPSTGTEFQQRVTGVVEALISMQVDLDSEKRSTKRLWSKREKLIHRAVGNLASFYGDLQGFIGTSLPTIEGLDVPKLECDDRARIGS